MPAIQLEFNLKDESEIEIRLKTMQSQIDAMSESMGKVRRKLFAQMGQVQLLCHKLETQNQELLRKLQGKEDEKISYRYLVGENLFEVESNNT